MLNKTGANMLMYPFLIKNICTHDTCATLLINYCAFKTNEQIVTQKITAKMNCENGGCAVLVIVSFKIPK